MYPTLHLRSVSPSPWAPQKPAFRVSIPAASCLSAQGALVYLVSWVQLQMDRWTHGGGDRGLTPTSPSGTTSSSASTHPRAPDPCISPAGIVLLVPSVCICTHGFPLVYVRQMWSRFTNRSDKPPARAHPGPSIVLGWGQGPCPRPTVPVAQVWALHYQCPWQAADLLEPRPHNGTAEPLQTRIAVVTHSANKRHPASAQG